MLKYHTGMTRKYCHYFVSKPGDYNAVEGLLKELGCSHNHEEWRYFADLI
jgi:hypothetical protein